MKLGNGQSTYVDFYASVGNGTVKMWSQVKEGKFALSKGWVIERVSVLGLKGTGQATDVQINGSPMTEKIEVSSKEHTYVIGLEDEEENKSVMVEIAGLEMLVGKDFKMSWKMGMH
ncbi:PREDICTED: alpha-xylosidase 1-like [Camelina sativa]|nr:PREDICTED: alpha-xylosidase 1-like [Camelina sativa]